MKFKELLRECDLRQIDLAKKLNITQSLISQWIAGKCQPQIAMLPKLSAVLGVSVEDIVNCFEKETK